MNSCIICKKKTKLLNKPLNTAVAPMSTKVVKFKLEICSFCGHIQKRIDANWKKNMNNVYEKNYIFLGKHISVINNKVIDRNDLISKILKNKLKLNSIKNGNFLDVGCGAGYFVKSFKKNLKNWNIYAHDLTDLNKKLVLKNKIKNFFTGNLSNINERFHIISLNHVLEHLTQPFDIFKQLHNLLMPNGYLVLRLPNAKIVHTDLIMLDHCSHFTIESIRNLLKISGFKVHKILNNINPIELFVIAKKNNGMEKKIIKNSKKEVFNVINQLMWPAEICKKIKRDNSKKRLGLFGVGTSSFYTYAVMKKKIKFFVDEDTSKIGKKYHGKNIYALKNTPENARVYIGVHNRKFAKKIKLRLEKKFKKIEFIVP